MPRGDATGPPGQGRGTGRGTRGSGFGRNTGRGRMGGNRPGAGPVGVLTVHPVVENTWWSKTVKLSGKSREKTIPPMRAKDVLREIIPLSFYTIKTD